MKYAIDRYSIGAETEVSANDFDGQYIPARKNRFYCPECGELVYIRNGQYNVSHFYHQEKTNFWKILPRTFLTWGRRHYQR